MEHQSRVQRLTEDRAGTPGGDPPTVVHAVLAACTTEPDASALIFHDETVTYGALADRVWRAAGRLEQLNLVEGARVAVLTSNDTNAIVAALAIMHVGGVWVPVNPRDAEADIGAVLRRVDCELLLFATAMCESAQRIRSLAGIAHLLPIPELRNAEPTGSPIGARPDGMAAVFFTGGTTGLPKGVIYHHRNFAVQMAGYVSLSVQSGDVALIAGPLTHAAGRQCLASLTAGIATVILPDFDPVAFLAAVDAQRVTFTSLSPTMLYRVLDHPEFGSFDHSSLRALLYGAAPIALGRLKQALDAFGPVMLGVFGQTESPMLIASLLPSEHMQNGRLADDDRLRSVGRPTRYSDVRIINGQGDELPAGEVGEIVVAGDYQMTEYWQDPVASADARWGRHIRTGDLGSFDQEGYLTIRGRKKDMIISGGFNVYAVEVENALSAHPDVAEAAVYGLPDDLWGESVNAAVIARPGRKVNVDELTRWTRDRIGGVKAPKTIRVVAELPRNNNGKILKRLLVKETQRD